MCYIGKENKESNNFALFNPDRCGVKQNADPDSTNDGDVKPIVKGQKQDASTLVNDTVRVIYKAWLYIRGPCEGNIQGIVLHYGSLGNIQSIILH